MQIQIQTERMQTQRQILLRIELVIQYKGTSNPENYMNVQI